MVSLPGAGFITILPLTLCLILVCFKAREHGYFLSIRNKPEPALVILYLVISWDGLSLK